MVEVVVVAVAAAVVAGDFRHSGRSLTCVITDAS